MQYTKTLLSVSLIVGSFQVHAEIQPRDTGDQIYVTPRTDMQMSQSGDPSNTTQKQARYLKVPVAPLSQSKPAGKTRAYEVPLSDYNNGGHFGN